MIKCLTQIGSGIGTIAANIRQGRSNRGILQKGSTSADVSAGIGGVRVARHGSGGRRKCPVSGMMSSRSGRMNAVAVVGRRGVVVVVVRVYAAVRRVTRMHERMRRVVPERVHAVMRMRAMVRVVHAVVVATVVRMARVRAQVGGSGGGGGAIRQAQEVGQVLPAMFHAHRAHQRHAHLDKSNNKKPLLLFTAEWNRLYTDIVLNRHRP